MPFELSFTKPVTVSDPEQYINPCCWGGDVIRDQLLPVVKQSYGPNLESDQEDWGWFIWFRKGEVRLAIDIFCDDPESGLYRIWLTSRKRKVLFEGVVDTPELEELRDVIVPFLQRWAGPVTVERVKG